jgi:tetratricopeptide (TPR) repeat protein
MPDCAKEPRCVDMQSTFRAAAAQLDGNVCVSTYNSLVSCWCRITATVLLFGLMIAAPARGNPESVGLTAKGYALAYNLDHQEALATLRQAVAADPGDAAAYRGIAATVLLDLLFRRGALTVDDYLGRARPTMHMPPAPPQLVSAFNDSVGRSLALAERQVAANPDSADAHYQVGASVGLLASFTAGIEGRVLSGFVAARRAYDEHERVLELDARRRDACFVVGTYRYVVSTLSAPLRLMAYMAGLGGGRERGMAMLEEAAAYPSDIRADARVALVIIYNREQRYADAMRVLEGLERDYPRNRLLWLSAGSTELRAGHAARAVQVLDEGYAKLSGDSRPRMFGEEALWRYERGAALVALRRVDAAERELRAGLGGDARDWVRGRLRLELGKLSDLAGNRPQARDHYRIAAGLFQRDNDIIGLAEANRFLEVPYR